MSQIVYQRRFLYAVLVITSVLLNDTTSFVVKYLSKSLPGNKVQYIQRNRLYCPGQLPQPMHSSISTTHLQKFDSSVAESPIDNNFLVRLFIPPPAKSGNKTADVMHGIVKKSEAEELARMMKLDLVVLNDKISPPLYKIVDKAKFEYEKEKKRRELSKKNINIELKEVKISYQITEHDKTVRINTAKRFLSSGHRVRVVLPLRGRQKQYIEEGRSVVESFCQQLEPLAKIEADSKREDMNIAFLLSPRKQSVSSASAQSPSSKSPPQKLINNKLINKTSTTIQVQ